MHIHVHVRKESDVEVCSITAQCVSYWRPGVVITPNHLADVLEYSAMEESMKNSVHCYVAAKKQTLAQH